MANLEEKKPKMVIVGAGPAGLEAALSAAEQGYDVTVVEAADRIGGKAQTAELNGKKVNICPTFISKDDTTLLARARAFEAEGLVKLLQNEGQGKEVFMDAAGKQIPAQEFFKTYDILRTKLSEIKVKMKDQNSAEYKRFHGKSMAYLLEYVRTTTPMAELSLMGRVWQTLTFQTNRVGRDITKIAEVSYAEAEVGAKPEKVDCEQFLSETVPEPGEKQDRFISNGCEYSVEGGTHQLFDAMHQKCKKLGVKFQLNTKVERIDKNTDGSLNITGISNDGAEQTFTGDQTVVAVHHKAAPRIKGLDKLGFKSGQMIADLQDANMVKFTIDTQPGVELPDVNVYANLGYQCWIDEEGTMTFLCHKDPSLTSAKQVKKILENYAASEGKTRDKVFMPTKGHISFNDPGTDNPAYITLAPGQKATLMAFRKNELPELAKNGVYMAGAHIPRADGSVGFMDNAVASAQEAVSVLKQNLNQQTTKWREQVREQNVSINPAMGMPMKPRDGRESGRLTSV